VQLRVPVFIVQLIAATTTKHHYSRGMLRANGTIHADCDAARSRGERSRGLEIFDRRDWR
jgi:hypothetical protein